MINDYYKVLNSLYKDIDFREDWKVYPVRFEPDADWYFEENNVFFKFPEEEMGEEDEDRILNSYPVWEEEDWTEYEILKPCRFYEKVIYEGEKYTGVLVDTHEDGNVFLMIFLNQNKQEL